VNESHILLRGYGKENIIVCMLFLDNGLVPASVLFIKEASVHK